MSEIINSNVTFHLSMEGIGIDISKYDKGPYSLVRDSIRVLLKTNDIRPKDKVSPKK